MAYEKQTWQTGEVITADKLNHIEDGISNAGGDGVSAGIQFVDFWMDEDSTLSPPQFSLLSNKTFSEVKEMLDNNQMVYAKLSDEGILSVLPFSYINTLNDTHQIVFTKLSCPHEGAQPLSSITADIIVMEHPSAAITLYFF